MARDGVKCERRYEGVSQMAMVVGFFIPHKLMNGDTTDTSVALRGAHTRDQWLRVINVFEPLMSLVSLVSLVRPALSLSKYGN
jgi:hypothetical protein